jgi:sec-independent protein translocase protein TatC
VFGFMASVQPEGVAWMTDIEKYLSFVLTTFIAFGVTFEVPVAVLVLVQAGIVEVDKLREWRPYIIVGAFVIGAIFTPPDVISQLMMAIPLCLLFELGLLLARFLHRLPAPAASVDDSAGTAASSESGLWKPASGAEMDTVAGSIDRQEKPDGKPEA